MVTIADMRLSKVNDNGGDGRSEDERMIEVGDDVYRILRRRAKCLRWQSFSVLLLIMLLIGFGGYIFFNASDIARGEISHTYEARISAVQDEVEDLEKDKKELLAPRALNNKSYVMEKRSEARKRMELDRVIGELLDAARKKRNESGRLYNHKLVTEKIGLDFCKEVPKSKVLCERVIKGYKVRLYYADVDWFVDELSNQFQDRVLPLLTIINKHNDKANAEQDKIQEIVRENRRKLGGELKKLEKEMSEKKDVVSRLEQEVIKKKYYLDPTDEQIRLDMTQLIQTNITRFGTLLLLLFLVRLMINLYRYGVRLAAFYDARADSILLLYQQMDSVHLSDLSVIMSPDTLDFGKIPDSPGDQAVELTKSLLSKVK